MTPPRHVLMTADTVGGVWTYCLELARALTGHAIQVSIATMGQLLSPSQRREAQTIANLAVFESSYKLEWMEDPWQDVDKAGEWLLSLERELHPDIVHLNGYAHGALQWKTPTVIVGHSCVLSWFHAVRRVSAPAQWNEYRRRTRDGLHHADALVAVSRSMAAEMERWYEPGSQITTIYNCRRPADYECLCKQEFVLSCGRLWDEAKNIRALDQVSELLPWPVFVAGEEQHPEGGRPKLNRIRPMGRLSPVELRDWYGRAAIYALPARYEPFGLSVLEAALSGCALVLGDISSLREIWHDAAMFVPPDDHEALAVGINILARQESLREKFARRARARALTFTSERMLQGYLDVYSQAHAIRRKAKAELTCAS